MHPKTNTSTLEVVLSTLHSGGKFDNNSYKISGGLHGVGLSVVNALSSNLIAEIYKNGKKYNIEYKNGKLTRSLNVEDCDHLDGTKITFQPNEKYFKSVEFDKKYLKYNIREMALLMNKIKFEFVDEKIEESEIYLFEDGISTILKEQTKGHQIGDNIIINHVNENMELNVGLNWINTYDPGIIKAYTNNVIQTEGAHITGLKLGITRSMQNFIKSYKNKSVTGEDIRAGLNAIISLRMPNPKFSSQTKEKLISEEAKKFVESALIDFFNMYAISHKKHMIEIAEKIINTNIIKNKIKNIKQAAHEVKAKLDNVLPGKLVDAYGKDPELKELFIVEGSSAGSTAKGSRNNEIQAILPLKGKILNIEKAIHSKIFNNEEIKSLIISIGTGIQEQINLNKLRYGKIIITTDPDSDGKHILVLLLTFFLRYMQPIIEEEKLYVAMSPLYSIQKKKENIFFENEYKLYEYLIENIDNKEKNNMLKILNSYVEIKKIGPIEYIEQIIYSKFIPHKVKSGIEIKTANKLIMIKDKYYSQSFNDGILSVIDDIELICHYKLKHGIDMFSMVDDTIKTQISKYDIKRYKGLGEMNEEQLWETTLNPKTRNLKKVLLSDAEETSIKLEKLMGTDSQYRKQILEEMNFEFSND